MYRKCVEKSEIVHYDYSASGSFQKRQIGPGYLARDVTYYRKGKETGYKSAIIRLPCPTHIPSRSVICHFPKPLAQHFQTVKMNNKSVRDFFPHPHFSPIDYTFNFLCCHCFWSEMENQAMPAPAIPGRNLWLGAVDKAAHLLFYGQPDCLEF